MASYLHPLMFLFLLAVKDSLSAQKPLFNDGFLLGVTKDINTHQYTTNLQIGTPQIPTKLVVHLSAESLFVDCSSSSSSRNFIRHGSLSCLMAKSSAQIKTRTSDAICAVQQRNPVTGAEKFGNLVEDIVTNDGNFLTVDRFLFSCSPEYLLKGLVTGAKGILGFGRSKIAFQSQIVNNFDIPRKFTVCLSSTDGFIASGTGVSNSLSYTPLISNTHGVSGYYLNVKSIKINRRKVVLPEIGGVEVSSIVPYTTMKSSIFEIFSKAYEIAAIAMNLTVVAPVAPFEVCFRSQTMVPEMELVLQSELVKWKIQRRNLMVEVNDSVMCLGVVDGGSDLNGSVVLGGHQLEDHILEFNLGTSMLGFSSSLLIEGSSCSNIKASISPKMGAL